MNLAEKVFQELNLPKEGFIKSKKGFLKEKIEYNSFFTMLEKEDAKTYLLKLLHTSFQKCRFSYSIGSITWHYQIENFEFNEDSLFINNKTIEVATRAWKWMDSDSAWGNIKLEENRIILQYQGSFEPNDDCRFEFTFL